MKSAPPRSHPVGPDLRLLGGLYLVELSLLVFLVVVGKATVAQLALSLTVRHLLVAVAVVVLMAGVAVIVSRYRTRGQRAPRQFGLTVVLNLVPLLAIAAIAEVAVRALAQPGPRGPTVMRTPLLPWAWADMVSHNRALLDTTSIKGSYLVADSMLGWTIGPSRRSADGQAFSSVEGLRSAEPGAVLDARRPPHRVAILGDSFTFGLEVSYPDTWGDHLERALGPDVQVLNFGVDGYGVDQAYLRYRRDVPHWRPDVVILGLITHDLFRSLATYSFVSFPVWPFPFAKPRFVADGGQLRLLNVPLSSPAAILEAGSVSALPFVQYDPGYAPEDWKWTPLDRSFLYRFLVSKYRRWSEDDARVWAEATEINREIVRAFIRDVRAAGSLPMVVYFPSRVDFRQRRRDPAWESLAQTMLRRGEIPHLDLTACVGALPSQARYGQQHLSPRANEAVAGCLREPVARLLSGAPGPRPQ